MSELTESQRRIVEALKREMVEITSSVLDEIQLLRKEQTERHEQGVREKAERDEKLKRHILGILAAFGFNLNQKEK